MIARKKLLIVHGNLDEIFIELIIELIENTLRRDFDLEFISTFHGDTIQDVFLKRNVDLLVLMLNNTRFPASKFEYHSNISNGLEFISHIKNVYRIPIIALESHDAALYSAKKAGADYSMKVPFKLEEFQKCIREIFKVE